jgi:hypothetical protein
MLNPKTKLVVVWREIPQWMVPFSLEQKANFLCPGAQRNGDAITLFYTSPAFPIAYLYVQMAKKQPLAKGRGACWRIAHRSSFEARTW